MEGKLFRGKSARTMLVTCLLFSGREEDNYLNDFLCRRTQAGHLAPDTVGSPPPPPGLVIVHLADVVRDIPTDTSISRQTETHLFTREPHVSRYTATELRSSLRLEKLSSVLDDRVVRLFLTISRNQIYN